jgi:hypothetical protein
MLGLARLGSASRNTRSWHREEGCTVSDRPSTLSRQEMPELNTGFPHTARVWNYWLGGVVQAASKTLDFSQPVALMMLGILNHIVDDDEAHGIVDRLVDAVPSGSYLVVGHPTREVHGEAMAEAMRLWNERRGTPIVDRNRQELARFFDRLELLEPGVVSCSRWRPDPADAAAAEVSEFCAVGRKP